MNTKNKHIANQPPVYVVLGATGGIGSELSRRLSARSANLILAGRNREKLYALTEEMKGEPFPIADCGAQQIEAVISHAFSRHGRIDGVVNCIGSLLLKPAHLTTQEEFETVIATNLTSAFATLRSAAQAMKGRGGSIVLISSAAARTGMANHEAIAAAKAGVIGLAMSAAATYARYSVRINAVAPGLVRTPLTDEIIRNEIVLRGSVALHALGRVGEPEDVASAIEWLLDPSNNWITGQVLGIDGGLSTVRAQASARKA